MEKIPTLRIGDLEINPPIIQGAMGVRVSRSGLASAVANHGCAGIIASVGLGKFENVSGSQFVKLNDEALRHEIRKTKELSNGIFGVNIMLALSNYENLLKVSLEEGVHLIISGAGLPLDLPKYVERKDVKLIPIVSSARALSIILKKWGRRFNKIPDAVIVEGVEAGGHLGFSYQDIMNNTAPNLEQIVVEVIAIAKSFDPPIPVIAAGGIFSGKDIAHFLELGASGVQMSTRFVCTEECDVHERFKQAYLNCKKEDIVIINSPLGMPGRVIKNSFTKRIGLGETIPYKCSYRCLRTCDPKTAPYCIARVLANAAEGDLEESFVFAGSNAYRCSEIVTVKELIEKLTDEMTCHHSQNE